MNNDFHFTLATYEVWNGHPDGHRSMYCPYSAYSPEDAVFQHCKSELKNAPCNNTLYVRKRIENASGGYGHGDMIYYEVEHTTITHIERKDMPSSDTED